MRSPTKRLRGRLPEKFQIHVVYSILKLFSESRKVLYRNANLNISRFRCRYTHITVECITQLREESRQAYHVKYTTVKQLFFFFYQRPKLGKG